MANPSKAKGTKHESSCVDYLRESGWPSAERRALAGALDKGDITGLPDVVIEAKATASLMVPSWLREVDIETLNASAEIGVCWAKLRGRAAAKDGVVLMRPATFVKLLREAGY